MVISGIFERLRAFEPNQIPTHVEDAHAWARELMEELAPVIEAVECLLADLECLHNDADDLAARAIAERDAHCDVQDHASQLDAVRAAEKDPEITAAERRDLIDEIASCKENLVEAQQNVVVAARQMHAARSDMAVTIWEALEAWWALDRVPAPRLPSVRS